VGSSIQIAIFGTMLPSSCSPALSHLLCPHSLIYRLTYSCSIASGFRETVAPFLVVVSKLAGFSVLTLSFNVFETAMVLLSVMLGKYKDWYIRASWNLTNYYLFLRIYTNAVNTCLRDLSTNWLEGVVLLSAYAMVAIATTVL